MIYMKRPPKKWFYKMVARFKRQYPHFSAKRIAKIVAGIWHKRYGAAVKQKLIRAEKGNPNKQIKKSTVLAAIRSPNTPAQLREGMKKFARKKGWI